MSEIVESGGKSDQVGQDECIAHLRVIDELYGWSNACETSTRDHQDTDFNEMIKESKVLNPDGADDDKRQKEGDVLEFTPLYTDPKANRATDRHDLNRKKASQ